MIDVHCHLEQPEFDKDLDEVIRKCKNEGIKAIITSCAHPKDFEKSLQIVRKYKNYVFLTAGIHPEYIKEFSDKKIEEFMRVLEEKKNELVGIGEIGLDFYWIKEPEWQKKQEEMFRKFIRFAKKIDKPIVIHSRLSEERMIEILEQENAKKVDLHMFGANSLTKRVIDNGWFISFNTILLRSKKHKKVARDCPLENMMLETDSPWLEPSSLGKPEKKRNDSTSIKLVAEKLAEIKKTEFEKIWKKTGENATKFFRLPVL